MIRLLLTIFFLEVGLVLAVAPWSAYWERNYFAQVSPAINALVTNNYLRGAITGLGAVNLFAALADLAMLVRRRSVS